MAQSLTLKKKQRFLQLTQGVPREKLLFCPIDISKDFHRALCHDMDCHPLSAFFTFSASRRGFELFVGKLQAVIQVKQPQVLFLGMEPTDVY
jgi:hypothetical protein